MPDGSCKEVENKSKVHFNNNNGKTLMRKAYFDSGLEMTMLEQHCLLMLVKIIFHIFDTLKYIQRRVRE